MGCGDEKLSKSLTQTFTAHCNALICQQVTLSGDAEWPKVADAVIEARLYRHRSSFLAIPASWGFLDEGDMHAIRRLSHQLFEGVWCVNFSTFKSPKLLL